MTADAPVVTPLGIGACPVLPDGATVRPRLYAATVSTAGQLTEGQQGAYDARVAARGGEVSRLRSWLLVAAVKWEHASEKWRNLGVVHLKVEAPASAAVAARPPGSGHVRVID